MRRLLLFAALVFLLVPSYRGQEVEPRTKDDEAALQRLWLITELKGLETEAVKLDQPLARAEACAGIADAAWTLDQEWSKKLLRAAYELTFPDEEEQRRLRDRPLGAALTKWTSVEQARAVVRNRVLGVARRDNAFANQLAQLGAEQLGSYEENFRYAKLASEAVRAGDKEAAGRYILQAIEAEPTLIGFGFSILELAARDRDAADKLILQYLERLRAFPLSMKNQSAGRVHFILRQMVFPSANLKPELGRIRPAGRAALRAYIGYVIESLGKLEQSEPGSASVLRDYLLSTWLPLKQHAPELTGSFLELEKLSRRPGDNGALPQSGPEETAQARYQERLKSALDNGHPDDLTIYFAISREDFESARKLVDLLPDGNRKTEFSEQLNTQEAISLIKRGELLGAEKLAQQLTRALSILQVYPLMVGKCVADGDSVRASGLVYQAIKQLKRAEDLETIAFGLGRLAKSVAPASDLLALEVLDEAVRAANSSSSGGTETGQGRPGLEAEVFKILAPKDESRVRQAAAALNDRLQRINATAAIYQWKVKELADSIKGKRR
ncbi:MAG TPA: hypothetical protein VF723_14655 [Pyrinomonadaceae bacterium]|jgi:hypothetical protein